jgi:TolB-like protein/Tfp pilus assembly protein PilF
LDFIERLKRRKIVQWGLGYGAAAFALLQYLDIVAQQFDWPIGVQRGVTIASIAGFFVVVTLAWYHGERGAQRVTVTEGVLLALICAAGGGAIWGFALRDSAVHTADEAHEGGSVQAIRSIAVLPLDNYSGDSAQDYFAEGMTDQITAHLATISQLRVTSRGSTLQFKGDGRLPTPDIARMLDVDALIEGSVLRIGDRVRITVQLIDARTDSHLWAKSFDGDSHDILALQDQLASDVAREIDVELTPAEASRFASDRRVDPQAYDAYLAGRYFFFRLSDDNLKKAIRQFERAIELDPEFAPAYAGLADTYQWAGFNEGIYTAAAARLKAKSAAERAVRLDDDSAEAHNALAVFAFWCDYDWDRSEREFRRAIALNPSFAYARDQFAVTLAFMGRFEESLAESRRAVELDPLSPLMVADAALALAWQGRFDEAKKAVASAEYLDRDFFYVPWLSGWVDIQAGKASEAIPALKRATEGESPPFALGWLGYAYGAAGETERALETLDEISRRSQTGYVPAFTRALVYLGLGDRARALDNLEQAYAEKSQWLAYLKPDRVFDPIREEPRFVELAKRVDATPAASE